MKIAGIITEYNPFHLGHKYQLQQIKSKNLYTIVIMSSSFTQRGTPAIIDKFSRTDIALENGADLVIELPVVFSTQTAEIFAKGAISILNSLQSIDYLYFGSENSIEDLISIENKINLNSEYIKNKMKSIPKKYSYIQARELCYDFLNEYEIDLLKKPNNILALEYIKSLNELHSEIVPKSIIRKSINHHSEKIIDNITSASNIRKCILNNNFDIISNTIPKETKEYLINNKLNELNNYFEIFKYKILSSKINYSDYVDYEKGLENRFLKFIDSSDIEEFISKVSSKRYTKSRISRLITSIILDINRKLIEESYTANYIRVLGCNSNGFKILKLLKEKNINIINKFFIYDHFNTHTKNILTKEILATNLYNIMVNKPINEDYTNGIIVKKNLEVNL